MHITAASLFTALFVGLSTSAPTTSRRETRTLVGLIQAKSVSSYEELYINSSPCTVLERLQSPGIFPTYGPNFACRFYT
jgi:hypothetical protein